MKNVKICQKVLPMRVTASEIKAKGVSLFDNVLDGFGEIIINVRGKDKYCVIPFEEYEKFKTYKLEQAHKEAIQDINSGNYHTDLSRHFDTIEGA